MHVVHAHIKERCHTVSRNEKLGRGLGMRLDSHWSDFQMVHSAILTDVDPKCVHITIEWEARSVANCYMASHFTCKLYFCSFSVCENMVASNVK